MCVMKRMCALTAVEFVRSVLTVCMSITHLQGGDACAIAAREFSLLVTGGHKVTCSAWKRGTLSVLLLWERADKLMNY